MKTHNITIDINTLTTEQLEQLKAMTYFNGQTTETKEINDRIAFIEGRMTEKQEDAYMSKWC
ncbi:MAG: hypothetical protein PUF69_04835 [Eubacteriales bacterium]|nr:hypothetical protein [Eubacteriales bacterium]